MAVKMMNVFAFLLLLLPCFSVTVAGLPAIFGSSAAQVYGRDTPSPDEVAPLAGSDNKTNIDYCGKADTPTFLTEGDTETGPGFYVTNNDISGEHFFLIENSRDTHPWKYLHVPIGARKFVQVCSTWQGRLMRGTPKVNTDGRVHNLGTWIESSVVNGVMSGDVSFLQGCDGGAKVASNDGRGLTRGCTVDMLSGAPSDALQTKDTGTPALKRITGDGFSQSAKNWDLSKCDASQVFIEESNLKPIIDSTNGRFEVTFYKGKA
ncbi:hypothetical protein PG999_001243 [Apiospora kogelbergensis]|uniref:Uncharacterized protein n=1 Tax=Apiospora kogelbergensis TaxID=1337665 RepID=A0AAW0RDR3_9PEZI